MSGCRELRRGGAVLRKTLLVVLIGVVSGCFYDWNEVELQHPATDAAVEQSPRDLDVEVRVDALQADIGPVDAATPDAGGLPPVGICAAGWCTLAAGSFTMGSPTNEPCRSKEVPDPEVARRITLTRPFAIASHETTQAEFEGVMGFNPSAHSPLGAHDACGPDCPVENVTWHQAAAYCNGLTADEADGCYECVVGDTVNERKCGAKAAFSGSRIYACPGYRLPTEAEWEYAYRAGSQTPLYPSPGNDGSLADCSEDGNVDQIGWYMSNSNENYNPVPHRAGLKAPNAWGLYDLSGNVSEWCHDRFLQNVTLLSSTTDPVGPANSSKNTIRGGSHGSTAENLRGAYRSDVAPDKHYPTVGFRCVRTAPAGVD